MAKRKPFKLVILGENGVGKTSMLITNMDDREFPDSNFLPTVFGLLDPRFVYVQAICSYARTCFRCFQHACPSHRFI